MKKRAMFRCFLRASVLVSLLGVDPLQAQEFFIAPGPGAPHLAFDGTQYMVVKNATGWRVLPDGTVLNPGGLDWEIPGDSSYPPALVSLPRIIALSGSSAGFSAGYEYHYSFCISPLMCDYVGWLGKASVSPDGTPLEAELIPLSGQPTHIDSADITSSGTQVLLVWGAYTGTSPGSYLYTIRGHLFAPGSDGVDLSFFWRYVNPDFSYARYPQAAFGNGQYLVAWVHSGQGVTRIVGTRVSLDGTFLDPVPVELAGPVNGTFSPVIAYCEPYFLVVWNFEDAILGARVTDGGEILDPDGFVIHEGIGSGRRAVASDGSGFLVLWEDDAYQGVPAIYGTRVSLDAVVGQPFRISGQAVSSGGPDLAFDGSRYLVVWQQQEDSSYNVHGALLLPPTPDDPDGDGVSVGDDNCPEAYNPLQTDADGDGFGEACDCDDSRPGVNPLATEVCGNELDDDCDGIVDYEDTDCPCMDLDEDGFGAPTNLNCPHPEEDCDDTRAEVHPFATEVCNLVDDDCDHSVDEGFDLDQDGWTSCGGDCDDGNPNVNPGRTEAPGNGVDDDCNPNTPSWGTPASTMDTAYAQSSDKVNALFILLPMGAILFLRMVHRQK